MKKCLTPEERLLLVRLESMGKWDHLLYGLTVLVPSFTIMGVGVHFDSKLTIVAGMIIYMIFVLQTYLRQAKTVPVMKSILKKLSQDGDENVEAGD